MKQILFATSNKAKVDRFKKDLLKNGIEIITLNDISVNVDVEENGNSAIENALIKARAYHKETGMITIAMDDNLYLENVPLDKQPGMYVRRVNGKRLTDEEMIKHYTNLVKKYGENGKLTAKWIYGMALIKDGKEFTYTWEKGDFYLIDSPSDKIKEGYPLNSISVNKKLNKYFTDITEEDELLIQEDESDVIEFIVKNT